MVKRFLNLEWKLFFRSASLGKSMAIKGVMVFLAIWMAISFLAMGFGLYPLIEKVYPEQDPFVIVNSYLFYWVLMDLIMRFFLQKLPVMSVKPLLTLPIKRRSIVNFVLGKSALSFYNILPLFATIPFAIMLLANNYNVTSVLVWVFAMCIIAQIVNFLNFIIESLTAASELSFLPLILISSALFGLNYFEIFSFSEALSSGIIAITKQPAFILVLIIILVGLYLYNFKLLKQKLYLDSSLKTKTEAVNTADLAWAKRFGDLAPFLQLDLKLIWRNKRPRSTIFLLIFGLLYGLFFYTNPAFQGEGGTYMYGFVGIFVTGIFLINFGQFIPAWDSGYYKMLMSQNIKYKEYLRSKHVLMSMSVIILFVLSTPYVYFGWKILLAHFAAAIYNIGVNTHVILFAGSFNRKKINLNQRAAFNYQGTGAVQWLLGIPLMLFPIIIFSAGNFLVNFETGIAGLIFCGVIGIVFHQKIMTTITKKYLSSKYKTIQAFSEDD